MGKGGKGWERVGGWGLWRGGIVRGWEKGGIGKDAKGGWGCGRDSMFG